MKRRTPKEFFFRGKLCRTERYSPTSNLYVFKSPCAVCGRHVQIVYGERAWWNGLCAICDVDRLAQRITVEDYVKQKKAEPVPA